MSRLSHFVKIFDEFSIQPFHMADFESLVELEKQSFPTYHWTADDLKEELERDPDCIHVIRHNSKVVGYVHTETELVKSKNGEQELVGEVSSIAVDREFRGRQLGEKLFRFGVKRLQNMGVDRVIINTKLDNHAMKNLAESKFGFEVTRIVKDMFYDGDDAYEMVLA
ncbi:MAG TPA: GNAT family N-acetyltransferase [Patescibacteria group bacterium]|nr:GNAT family N-acetyltransferase [Patescibacteria group bacterium]